VAGDQFRCLDQADEGAVAVRGMGRETADQVGAGEQEVLDVLGHVIGDDQRQ
jgi:hypothetical protein